MDLRPPTALGQLFCAALEDGRLPREQVREHPRRPPSMHECPEGYAGWLGVVKVGVISGSRCTGRAYQYTYRVPQHATMVS
jgi:hypothetical protein